MAADANAKPVPHETARLRVAIADDALLLRSGIESVLTAGGCDVVASVGRADELVAAVRHGGVDVAVVDIRMPPSHTDEGLRALEELRSGDDGSSRVGVLLLSMYATTSYAIRAMRAGDATGYLLKERIADPASLISAVRTVAGGGVVVDSEVVGQLVRRESIEPLASLTPREHEVLAMMAEGKSNAGIASTLFVSPKTIETHIGNIMAKLGIRDSPDGHKRVLAVLSLLGRTG